MICGDTLETQWCGRKETKEGVRSKRGRYTRRTIARINWSVNLFIAFESSDWSLRRWTNRYFRGRRFELAVLDVFTLCVRIDLGFAVGFATGGFEAVFAFLSTRFLWAVCNAPRTTSSLATARLTCVMPPRPQ